jgi:16S rRNA (cytidine1402-2'-O)-methyltransferase
MGTLYLVSTPIGNLGDITLRALDILSAVEVILCEDTRKTGLLLTELARRFPDRRISPSGKTLTRYDEFMEAKRLPEIIDLLTRGIDVALVSDAGTPLMSDPGYPLVRECRKRDIPVIAVPGPVAAIAALVSSGLPTQPFLFLGYPPKAPGHRREWFGMLKQHAIMFPKFAITVGCYCSPHDLSPTLSAMLSTLGDIPVVVARELTKIHEECWSGTVTGALARYQSPKGEFVLLFRLPV